MQSFQHEHRFCISASSFKTYEAPCDYSGKTKCDWTHLICDKSQLEVLAFNIPVGNLGQKDFIVITTTTCTLGAVLWLAIKMHSHRFLHEKLD